MNAVTIVQLRCRLYTRALTEICIASRSPLYFNLMKNIIRQRLKGRLYIYALLTRGLEEFNLVLVRQLLSFLRTDTLTIIFHLLKPKERKKE